MKKDDIYRSQFRLPWELYEKLKEQSDLNRRSLNAEVVARLEASIRADEVEENPYAVRIPDVMEDQDFLELRDALLKTVSQLDALFKESREDG